MYRRPARARGAAAHRGGIGSLSAQLDRAFAFAEDVAKDPDSEDQARVATNALYYATAATLMAWEGAQSGTAGGDARRVRTVEAGRTGRIVGRRSRRGPEARAGAEQHAVRTRVDALIAYLFNLPEEPGPQLIFVFADLTVWPVSTTMHVVMIFVVQAEMFPRDGGTSDGE